MKPTTYYIQNKKGVCIKANNIESISKYCLDAKTVRLHLQLQRMKMQEDTKYRPQPIVFKVNKEEMRTMVSQLKKKVKNLISEEHIALQTQSTSAPVILIIEKQKEDGDKKESGEESTN